MPTRTTSGECCCGTGNAVVCPDDCDCVAGGTTKYLLELTFGGATCDCYDSGAVPYLYDIDEYNGSCDLGMVGQTDPAEANATCCSGAGPVSILNALLFCGIRNGVVSWILQIEMSGGCDDDTPECTGGTPWCVNSQWEGSITYNNESCPPIGDYLFNVVDVELPGDTSFCDEPTQLDITGGP